MFSELADFLCGPFFYPVFFASFLHAFDFFVNLGAPQSTKSQPRSHFQRRSASHSPSQPQAAQTTSKQK
jgi:hypothetical protein